MHPEAASSGIHGHPALAAPAEHQTPSLALLQSLEFASTDVQCYINIEFSSDNDP